MAFPFLLIFLGGAAAVALGGKGSREASGREQQVLDLVASGIPLEQLEVMGYGRIVGYEPGAGPGGWVGQGGDPPESPICYWDEELQDCGPSPCPPDFPDCVPVPNCPPDQRWYGELGACYRPDDVPQAEDGGAPQCSKTPPQNVFCEQWERPICVNGVWFCVTQPEPDPEEGEPCGRTGYAGTIGTYDDGDGLLCEGTPGSLNGRWRRPKRGDACPPAHRMPPNMHCAFGEIQETRAGQPCTDIGQYLMAGGVPLYCNSHGRLVNIDEGEECSTGAPGGTKYQSPDGTLVCYSGEWRKALPCPVAGAACGASFGLARFSCWSGSPKNIDKNRCYW